MPRTKKPERGGKREGAGRKPLTEGIRLRDHQITTSLPAELLDRIDKARGDVPRSAFLRDFLEKSFPPSAEPSPVVTKE